MRILLLILTMLMLVSVPSHAGQPQQEVPTQEVNKPPFDAPHPDTGAPISLILIGAIAAGAIATNPWIVLGILAGIILIIFLLLFWVLKKESPIPQKNNYGLGIYMFITFLFLALLALFTGLVVIGLSYLIALITGTAADLLFGAAAIVGIGIVWLAGTLIAHFFRVRKYKKRKKLFEYERA